MGNRVWENEKLWDKYGFYKIDKSEETKKKKKYNDWFCAEKRTWREKMKRKK